MQKRFIGFLISCVMVSMLGFSDVSAATDEISRNYVSGIFIAPELCPDASAREWRNAMQNMSRIGIDTVIVQYTFQTDSSRGTQAYFDYWQKDMAKGVGKYLTRRNQVGHILEAAQQHGIKVYLGLQLAERDWFDKNRYQKYDWLYHQFWLSSDLASALWAAFGETYGDTIAGWYLPFELESTKEYYPYISQIVKVYYGPVTSFLKSDSRFGHLPIMISPLMYRDDDKNAWQDNLKSILSSSAIDIIAPQDGIGFGTQTHETVGDWYRATRDAVNDINNTYANKHISLWANCENYSRLRNPKEPVPIERFKPMAINKFIDSLDIAGPYADKLITFSIHRWDTAMYYNNVLGVNRSYYEAYSRYYATGVGSVSKSNGYYVSIQPAKGANLTLHPHANAGLTDGFAADIENWGQYKGIGASKGKPITLEIRFDDPISISSISSHYFQDGQSGIVLPQQIKYEYIVRSGKRDHIFTYILITTDQPSGTGQTVLSAAELPTPVVADGVRITVTPGGEWAFIDDIWVT